LDINPLCPSESLAWRALEKHQKDVVLTKRKRRHEPQKGTLLRLGQKKSICGLHRKTGKSMLIKYIKQKSQGEDQQSFGEHKTKKTFK